MGHWRTTWRWTPHHLVRNGGRKGGEREEGGRQIWKERESCKGRKEKNGGREGGRGYLGKCAQINGALHAASVVFKHLAAFGLPERHFRMVWEDKVHPVYSHLSGCSQGKGREGMGGDVKEEWARYETVISMQEMNVCVCVCVCVCKDLAICE